MNCSLAAYPWHAQYYTTEDLLVEDDLVFSKDGKFEQNATAFPFQPCMQNWVDWRGEYDQANATAMLLSYMRCTQSGMGCLACGPTHEEWVGVSFSDDCETVTFKHADSEPRTYFPSAQSFDRA